ncbi:hypothetical protein Godav_003371, partial [Gossypium davidsonii]|nr:hypothetical protein [Gossypium davidsonii]
MNQNSPTSFSISIHHSQQQATALIPLKKDTSSSSSIAGFFGKNGYKFWVLTAIILLAFWSMFTGSVSLKWSSGNLTSFSYDSDFSIREDLDVLLISGHYEFGSSFTGSVSPKWCYGNLSNFSFDSSFSMWAKSRKDESCPVAALMLKVELSMAGAAFRSK